MNSEQILEIARRFTTPAPDCQILFGEDGNPTGETLNLMMLNFCEEELIAFAQSVIEEERDTTKQLAAYKTLVGSFEKQITAYRQRLKELEGAEASLDSERECNAELTKELEAQESSERAAYWLLPGGVIVEYNPETYGIEGTAIGLLYRRPAPARKPLSDEEIRTIMLGNGFTIKEGCKDLKPYVYAAIRAIEKAHGIGETE